MMNILSAVFSACALVLLLVAAVSWIAHRSMFTLQRIELEGQFQHISKVSVRNYAVPQLSGNFFTLNLDQTRKAFENVPWVRKATVRRVWPNGLRVTLVEHDVLAYWGDSRLVSQLAEVFVVNLAEADAQRSEKLPVLSGPVGSERLVVDRFFRLNRQLKTGGFQVSELRLSDRFSWTAVLDNGLRIELGTERAESPLAAQVDLFLRSYPIVMAQMMKKLTVFDLRYPSGFALAGSSR
jgi:cell division protein FtsQ